MNDHGISQHEADALVDFVKVAAAGVRGPGRDWQRAGIVGGIRAALAERGHASLAELTYAAVTVAKDPTYGTPAAIAFNGPHWSQPKKPAVHRAQECIRCGGVHTPHSPCVPPEDERVDGSSGRTDSLRSALADARTRTCSHGVPRLNCTRHQEATDDARE